MPNAAANPCATDRSPDDEMMWWPFDVSRDGSGRVIFARGRTKGEAQEKAARLVPAGTVIEPMPWYMSGFVRGSSAFVGGVYGGESPDACIGWGKRWPDYRTDNTNLTMGMEVTPTLAALLGDNDAILLSYFEHRYLAAVHLKEMGYYQDALNLAEQLCEEQRDAGIDTTKTEQLIAEIKRLKDGEGKEPQPAPRY